MTTAISCCHGDVITALVSTLYVSNSRTDFDVQLYIVLRFRKQVSRPAYGKAVIK